MASSSAGVDGAGIEPCVISFSRTSGTCSTLAISWLTWSRIGVGVPAGANTANQDSYLYCGKVSAIVGTFGSCGTRSPELMAIALIRFLLVSSIVVGIGHMYICTSLRITAVTASDKPLNGTCTMLTPAFCLKISADRYEVLAT